MLSGLTFTMQKTIFIGRMSAETQFQESTSMEQIG